MTTRARKILAALLLACAFASGCGRERIPLSRLTALSGKLQVIMCPEVACGLPGPGDPHWDCVTLTPTGVDHPIPHREGVGWIRLSFRIDNAAAFRNPGLLVSNPADAEEMYINGVPAGGEGVIGPRYVTVPGPTRVIDVPPDALRTGENVLTMKVLFAARNVDLFDGPFLLGNHNRINLVAERMQLPVIGMEAAFLALFGLIIGFYSVLVSKSGYRADYILFIAFTANYALEYFLGSRTFHILGFGGSFPDHLQGVLAVVNSLLMLSLVTSVTRAVFGTVYLVLASATAVFIGLYALLPSMSALTLLDGPRKLHLLLLGLYYVAVSLRSVLKRREDAFPVLAGVLAYVIGSRTEEFLGVNLRDFSMGLFTLCMLYTLTSRHARMQSRLAELSARLLDAHEEERSRIARDIHDSVGQSLLALKLRLQMLASKVADGARLTPDAIEGLAKDTSGIIEEVRRTSMDLRPSFVGSMSLMETVTWYAGSFMERSGIELSVHGGEEPLSDPSPRIKDNLCRGLQEILTNARKHSGATRIDISLYRSGSTLVLRVTDNGRGADLSAIGKGGIGLATMQERAELLGGRCVVESAPGIGTTVTMEVPLQ
jgi:signal transduction histidine kinase